jgi:hypothetical protein
MSTYSMITSGGLVSVTEAFSEGILIDVKYFVPVYDWRIDPLIQTTEFGFSANDISSVTDPSDVIPEGEIIWYNDGINYSLSDSNNSVILISGGNTTLQQGAESDVVVNPIQLQHQAINLYNGNPLSQVISADSLHYAPSAAGVSWILENAIAVNGTNDRPTLTNGDFWSLVEYTSLINDDGTARGCFKCRINKNVGKFKFNKIGLYAVKLDGGTPFGDPFLFAQAILPVPEIKSSLGEGGLDEIVVEVQLQLNTIEFDWSNLVYGSQNDYWYKITEDGSLHHARGVYIGKFAPRDNNTRIAKTVITTWEDLDYGLEDDDQEYDKPQLAIQNVTSEIVADELVKTGHYSWLKVDSYGNLNLCLSADDGYYPDASLQGYDEIPQNSMIIPEFNEKFYLGSQDNRWKCLYVGTSGTCDFCSEYDGDEGGYNNPENDLLAIDIHGGAIQLGRSRDYLDNNFAYGLKMVDRSIRLENRYYDNSHILGADIKRKFDESMFVYTTKHDSDYIGNKTSGSHVFLVAGALEDRFNSLYGNYFVTRSQLNDLILTSGSFLNINDYFIDDAEMFLLAKGGINILSPMKFESKYIGTDYNFSMLYSSNYFPNSKSEKMLMVAGVKNGINHVGIVEAAENGDYFEILIENSHLDLVAGDQINFWGDITPLIDGVDDNNGVGVFGGLVQKKMSLYKQNGFSIGKLLDLMSCNVYTDNIRFNNYYEQPFSVFQELALNINFVDDVTITPAWGDYNSPILVQDCFREAKWARIGNMIVLKFYLSMSFNLNLTSPIRTRFRIPKVSIGVYHNLIESDLFVGEDNYLVMEVEGTNKSQFEDEGDDQNPDTPESNNDESVYVYHPVELMFSKDFTETGTYNIYQTRTEKETKVLVPAYSLLSDNGQPDGISPDGYPIALRNPFKTLCLRFYMSKSGSYDKDYTDLINYLNNPINLTNNVKTLMESMFISQGKDIKERSSADSYYINYFKENHNNTMFFTWETFKTYIKNVYNIDTKMNVNYTDHISKAGGRYRNWSIHFSNSIFKYDNTIPYPDTWHTLDGGHMELPEFTDIFKLMLYNMNNSIIKLNYRDFGGSDLETYFRINTVINTNSYIENVPTYDPFNSIGSVEANGRTITTYVPMIKVIDLTTNTRKRWTFGCEGHGENTIGRNTPLNKTGVTINDNIW